MSNAIVPDSHALRRLFAELVEAHFDRELGLHDSGIKAYIAAMLCDFCSTERLYKILNAAGRPLNDVGKMLLESNPVYGEAPSFEREREVRKHIGDYTLFFTGMYPESINRFRLRRHRLDNLIDWVKAGRESYYIVSSFSGFEYRKVAPLFGKLARDFEICVFGLNLVKNDLAERQHPIAQKANELIM